MKKVLSVLLVLMMLAMTLFTVVSADNFVPSISYKPAPFLVEYDEDGESIIGHVVDDDGNELTTEYHECLVITPVSEAESSEKIPEAAADLLLKVYADLSATDVELADLSDKLNNMVAEDLGEGKTANSLVVKDLFDVTVLCDELKENLSPAGNTLTLTFETSIEAGVPVYVMTYKNNKWEPIVSAVNNDDGTITCTFEEFCPVAFFVPSGIGENVKPEPGDGFDGMIWAVIMISAISLIAVILIANRKNFKKSELK